MMRKEVVLLALALALLAPQVAAVFLGTIEGYVYFLNGSLAGSAASVNASVASCSGSGCSGNTTTDANSYYVIANLNIGAGGTVTATAGKNLHRGSNTTTANAFEAASANITLCQAPSTPSLTTPPSNHDANRTLTWTSGVDSNGYPTYDVFQFSSNASVIGATSPRNVTGLTVGSSYTWRVSTCNNVSGNGCCSANATNTFNVSNTAPSAPTLSDQVNQPSGAIAFNWTSGTDSDGDATYNEFTISNTSDYSTTINSSGNATSPYTVPGLTNISQFFWRVRTCDVFGSCSSYGADGFYMFNCSGNVTINSITTTVIGSSGGGGCTADLGHNECSPQDRGCRGTSAKLECANFDTDYFLELGEIPCSIGTHCENGACVATCVEDWQCEDWSECSSTGMETRSCVDFNGCDHNQLKPVEQRTCIPGAGEAPILLGVPPFTIEAPQVLTTPVIPIATGMLGVILALLTLSLLFDKQFDAFMLYTQLQHERSLLRRKEFAKADVWNTRVVDSHMRKAELNERKPFHRKLLRMYYEVNRDVAKYHEQLARQVGEKDKVSLFTKRAEEYQKLVMKYAK